MAYPVFCTNALYYVIMYFKKYTNVPLTMPIILIVCIFGEDGSETPMSCEKLAR